MTAAVLVDKTNAIIGSFSAHPLSIVGLRNDLQARVESEQQQQQQQQQQGNGNALSKSSSAAHTENLTSYTNLSDGSAYSIDPTDLKRLSGDLDAYKQYFGQVKFQWMESNVKRKYLQRLLNLSTADGEQEQGLVMQADCEQAEEIRLARKAELKDKKAQVLALKQMIVELTSQLDVDLNQHLTPAIDEARSLSREIQDMEIELAMLRNSRPESERMTIEEANETLDEQIMALQNLQQTLSDSRARIASEKGSLVIKQKELERLMAERGTMDKLEAEARAAGKTRDKRIEEGCRQLSTRLAMLSAALGIQKVEPLTRGELRIVYELGSGRTATLAIYSDAERRRLTGAQLLDSSVSIEEIVGRCVKSNDLQQLVLEVVAKIS